MLKVALVVLLTAIQPSAPPQPELKGQPCTARDLVGTWQYTQEVTTLPGVTSVLKHVTPTHFFAVHLGANDVVQAGHGGTYTFADGTYRESTAHGFGKLFEMVRGSSVAFQCRMSGDVWHIVGELKGSKINEQWKRVSGSPAQR